MIPSAQISKRCFLYRLTCVVTTVVFLICPTVPATAFGETNTTCYRTFAAEALICRPQLCPGNLYAGGSVSFRLTPGHRETKVTGPSQSWLTITVMDREFPVVVLPESFYTGYRHLTLGPTDYWIISEFNRSMHGCDRYHVFSRPAPGKCVIYLGATTGGESNRSEPVLFCRDNSLYLEDMDIRLRYFHTSLADSRLLFPRYHQITPFTLTVENKPFRDQYLQLARETQRDIEKTLAERKTYASAILTYDETGLVFSDLLGQLLVRRTLLLIYAGETAAVWTRLAHDIRKYYQNDHGLMQIEAEITQILAESPY